MKIYENNTLGELSSAIGKGLLAGLAATAAITLSQMIEMKITKRKPSEAPIKVAKQTTGIKPVNVDQKEKVAQEIHWAYGTVWGVVRGLITLTGLKKLPATLAHFGAVWGAAMVMLPKFKAAPPVNEEKAQTIAIDGLHHAVYALTAGLIYDMLDSAAAPRLNFNRVIAPVTLKSITNRFRR
jgi:hypothetical protein